MTKKFSHNMALMSRYKGQGLSERSAKQFRQTIPGRKLFSWGGLPYRNPLAARKDDLFKNSNGIIFVFLKYPRI